MEFTITIDAGRTDGEAGYIWNMKYISPAGKLHAIDGHGPAKGNAYSKCVLGLNDAVNHLTPGNRADIHIASHCGTFLKSVDLLPKWAKNNFRKANGRSIRFKKEWTHIGAQLIGHKITT